MHIAADLLNHPNPSAHIDAEVVHTHSWDLTFLTKLALASHQIILHQKPKLNYLQECLFIVHLLQKEGFYSTPTPQDYFESQLRLQASTKTVELPKLMTIKGRTQTGMTQY